MLQEWINKIYHYKLSGLMWHIHWKDLLCYLGLMGYSNWQQARVVEELKELQCFENYVIKQFNLFPTMSNIDVTTMHSPTKSRWVISSIEKKEYLKAFLDNWLMHEQKGQTLYAEGCAWAMQEKHYLAQEFFQGELNDSNNEIAMIQAEKLNCENLNWDMTTLVIRQEEMVHRYRKHFKDFCKSSLHKE